MTKELPTRDWSSVEGAKALARIIQDYWKQRGYVVNVEIVSEGRQVYSHTTIGIRTDMVNGFPRYRISKGVRA